MTRRKSGWNGSPDEASFRDETSTRYRDNNPLGHVDKVRNERHLSLSRRSEWSGHYRRLWAHQLLPSYYFDHVLDFVAYWYLMMVIWKQYSRASWFGWQEMLVGSNHTNYLDQERTSKERSINSCSLDIKLSRWMFSVDMHNFSLFFQSTGSLSQCGNSFQENELIGKSSHFLPSKLSKCRLRDFCRSATSAPANVERNRVR